MCQKQKILIADSDIDKQRILFDVLKNKTITTIILSDNWKDTQLKFKSENINFVFLGNRLAESDDCKGSRIIEWCYDLILVNPTVLIFFTYWDAQTQEQMQYMERLENELNIRNIRSFGIPRRTGNPRDQKRILIQSLRKYDDIPFIKGTSSKPVMPNLNLIPETDYVLKSQIRMLSNQRDFQEGKNILSSIIQKMFNESENTFYIHKMGQGFSGSLVFRVIVQKDKEQNDFVIKIYDCDSVWKIESEIRNYEKARSTLYDTSLGTRHVPEIVNFETDSSKEASNIIYDSSKKWVAIAYNFLGGYQFPEESIFMDMETAYVSTNEEIWIKTINSDYYEENDLFKKLLADLLKFLHKSWYKHTFSKKRKLWSYTNANPQRYYDFPPYKLSKYQKDSLINSLFKEMDYLGGKFLDDKWEEYRKVIDDFIFYKPMANSTFYSWNKNYSKVLLSKVHGDLNSNNIISWLDKNNIFLIDFPFYQEQGHIVQDFTRLEAEIKFSLMDREHVSKDIHPLDWSPSQCKLWFKLEDHLQSIYWKKDIDYPPNTFYKNVNRAECLIKLIRKKAEEIYKTENHDNFYIEYNVSLLYHTLKAITYPSLSLFKRIYAVYSAGRMLTTGPLCE